MHVLRQSYQGQTLHLEWINTPSAIIWYNRYTFVQFSLIMYTSTKQLCNGIASLFSFKEEKKHQNADCSYI
uniref:Uncharacterized protein n=1 Tax=Oryza brachyantha TaxID=4533 RepID=J3MZX9_ORYBR